MIEQRFAPGSAPWLAANAITDADPDVVALEQRRWAVHK